MKKKIEMINAFEPVSGPKGFVAGGIIAGIKPSGTMDLAAILSDRPAVTAGVTTTNLFCSAPVLVCRERLAGGGKLRGVVVNAGIANACTGAKGYTDAMEMTRLAEKATGVEPGEFLVASTGVIGPFLPMDKITQGMPSLVNSLAPDGFGVFARAIMTTDTHPKLSRRTLKFGRKEVTILGTAKGSGMIHPNMATMLSFITTDYPLSTAMARKLLKQTVDRTYNCVTVDGDTSTSDTLILMANGAAITRAEATDSTDAKFAQAFFEVAEELSRMIARDGEGATKLIVIEVDGAADDAAARKIGLSIGNSPLVKTAMFGNDPNWGRISCAAGYAGVPFKPEECSVKLQGKPVLKNGMPVKFDKPALSGELKTDEVLIQVRVGKGKGKARVLTCDFSYDYVKINADYTT